MRIPVPADVSPRELSVDERGLLCEWLARATDDAVDAFVRVAATHGKSSGHFGQGSGGELARVSAASAQQVATVVACPLSTPARRTLRERSMPPQRKHLPPLCWHPSSARLVRLPRRTPARRLGFGATQRLTPR